MRCRHFEKKNVYSKPFPEYIEDKINEAQCRPHGEGQPSTHSPTAVSPASNFLMLLKSAFLTSQINIYRAITWGQARLQIQIGKKLGGGQNDFLAYLKKAFKLRPPKDEGRNRLSNYTNVLKELTKIT